MRLYHNIALSLPLVCIAFRASFHRLIARVAPGIPFSHLDMKP